MKMVIFYFYSSPNISYFSSIFYSQGKQINVATPEEWNRMRYDMQSLLSEGSFNDKEWDRDSAIDFEEVKLVARKPRLRTGSSVSGNSPPSMESKVASKINHSYIVDEPSSSHVCHFVVRLIDVKKLNESCILKDPSTLFLSLFEKPPFFQSVKVRLTME